jgi:transcriptional regulator with XRE-family HTH domain
MTGPQFTGKDLRAIRDLLGYSQAEMALKLGYLGSYRSRSVMICQMEAGTKPIPVRTAMAVQLLAMKFE